MDDHPDNEDAGLPLWEAFQRYCDPEIVRAWREAGAACGGDLRARRGSKHWKRVQRYYAAERAVVADGLDRLAWFGYLMPRVRGVGLELIPDAVLQARDRKIKGSTVAGIGLEFVGVLVYPAAKSPGAEKALFGQPLSEWYEQFVNDDETGRLMAECTIWHPEWAEILEHEYPGMTWFPWTELIGTLPGLHLILPFQYASKNGPALAKNVSFRAGSRKFGARNLMRHWTGFQTRLLHYIFGGRN